MKTFEELDCWKKAAALRKRFGRFHHQEYIQYCRQSRGSLYEIIDHLIVACEENYISEPELFEMRNEVNTCLAVLNGFINYLMKAKSRDTLSEPETLYSTAESGETRTDNE